MTRARGFTLIELMIVIAIIAIIAAIAIPNLLSARKNANETGAIGALKSTMTAQSIFREGDKENDSNLDYGMLTELSNTTLIDGVLGKGTKQGYIFQASYSVLTSEFLWFMTATPQIPTASADRYFCTNQVGLIFYTTQAAVPMDTSACVIPANLVPIVR